jgi:predicted  nucleic acid-binding Zn-ribbon protein
MFYFIKKLFKKEIEEPNKEQNVIWEEQLVRKETMNINLPEIKVPGFYGENLLVSVKYNDEFVICHINQEGYYFVELDNKNYIPVWN